jgi:hypothetical protein
MPDGRDFRTDAATPLQTINKDKPDPHGDMVDKIYVSTDEFTIYRIRLETCCHLRYVMPVANATARSLRANLMAISGLQAQIDDMVCELRATRGPGADEPRWEALRDRVLDLQARAMQLAFEGQAEGAAELLAMARNELESRRDSRNRMGYVGANLVALVATLSAWLVFESLTFPPILADLQALMTGRIALPSEGPGLRVIDMLALGALGAFFSVSTGIRKLRINPAIKRFEMLYTGFVRITIGVIAARYMIWTVYLFGFLAGFSEHFVPNALNQAEANAAVRAPATRTTLGAN